MIDEGTPEFRTVKYRKHGTLTKSTNHTNSEEFWVFETSERTNTYRKDEYALITILDELSIGGFELVTSHDGEYILRTKEEIEEVREFYDTDDD